MGVGRATVSGPRYRSILGEDYHGQSGERGPPAQGLSALLLLQVAALSLSSYQGDSLDLQNNQGRSVFSEAPVLSWPQCPPTLLCHTAWHRWHKLAPKSISLYLLPDLHPHVPRQTEAQMRTDSPSPPSLGCLPTLIVPTDSLQPVLL